LGGEKGGSIVYVGFGRERERETKCGCVGWGINGQEGKLSFERVCIGFGRRRKRR
jgi:hypothetical protein